MKRLLALSTLINVNNPYALTNENFYRNRPKLPTYCTCGGFIKIKRKHDIETPICKKCGKEW